MANANPLLSAATGLGEVFSRNVADFFSNVQGQLVPQGRPVNPSGDSFNFGDAFNSLLKPVVNLFDPREQAKADVRNATTNALGGIIKTAGSVSAGFIDAAGQALQNALLNNNKAPAITLSSGTPQSSGNSQPSQNSDLLAEALKLIDITSNTSNTAPATIAADAAASARNNVLLIGGVAVIATLFIITRGKK